MLPFPGAHDALARQRVGCEELGRPAALEGGVEGLQLARSCCLSGLGVDRRRPGVGGEGTGGDLCASCGNADASPEGIGG